MRKSFLFCIYGLLAVLASIGQVHAANAPAAQPQATMDALAKAYAAVVGVRVMVSAEAPSAETLGRARLGSGVVIGSDGLILTIGYLMIEAEMMEIVTQDNKVVPARAVAYDIATGFGLLRPVLPLRTLAPVPMGSVREMQVGEPLMVATGGEDGDVGMTQLVSKRPFSGYWEYHIDTALFTSPPVTSSGGNHSGAPVFNQKGELLGIGSLFVGDAMGVNRRMPGNMFVPIDLLKPILAEMQATGSTKQSHRPWLGLTSTEQDGRVQIVRVNRNSPALEAGLKPGDVVLAVDGAKVTTLEAFYKKLWDRALPDSDVSLTVLQGAELKTFVIKAVDRMRTMRKPAGI